MLSELQTPMMQWTTEWDVINGARYNHKEGRDAVNHIVNADTGFNNYMQNQYGINMNAVKNALNGNVRNLMGGVVYGANWNDPNLQKFQQVLTSIGGIGSKNPMDTLPNLAIQYVYNSKYLPQFQQVTNRYGADPNADFHNFAMNMRQSGTAASTEEATGQLWK
jgi:acylphosphatase